MNVVVELPLKAFAAATLCAALVACSEKQADKPAEPEPLQAAVASALQQGFDDPPAEARPRVWWHWMNGNISKEGISKDIEWMSRIGIGGMQNFDAALNTPQIVDERLVYMTPGWKDAFRHAAREADTHGMELAIAGSPGWSETGGPWIAPEDGMKKVVWSEAILAGGEPVSVVLPPLPSASGVFQDIDGHGTAALSSAVHEVPSMARDTLVLAVPVTDNTPLPLPAVRTAAGDELDASVLFDGKYAGAVTVAKGTAEEPTVVELGFDEPQTVRTMTLHVPSAAGMFGGASLAPALEAKADGEEWRKVADLPLSEVPSTVSFAPVTASEFRVVFLPKKTQAPFQSMEFLSMGVDAGSMIKVFDAASDSDGPSPSLSRLSGMGGEHRITEMALHTRPAVSLFEKKAGFHVVPDYYALAATDVDPGESVQAEQVIDLTGRMTSEGRLEWTPPPGTWKVLRFGYSLTGKTNHPAPPEATGLEVDKFDGEAVRRYMQTYLGNYREAAGEDLMGDRGLRALLTDSIEVGPANWTPKIIEQFKRLRGYDPTPWLPTLAGVVVGSGEQSDAFLYDYRRTLADLIASEHYGTIAEVTDELGLTYYSEAVETIRTTLGDDMAMRAPADVPMAAMWTYGEAGPDQAYILDIRGAASVAHIYGQNLVAAESLTSVLQPWIHSPAKLRPVLDLILAHGVNRPVIHTSVHQPADDRYPGLALLIFGQYFNRHETWADMAGPWVDYMARSSYLLQQGRHFADVAYFYGEEAPLTMLFKDGLPDDAPTRYAFDFINADALRDAVSVEDGEIVTAGGARYRVLYLGGNSHYMTLPVLRRLGQLVEAGATVVGMPPKASPSLADDAQAFTDIVRQLWGDGGESSGARQVGKGSVIASDDVESVLASLGVAPDFEVAADEAGGDILFQHRRLDDGDLYFLNNRADSLRTVEARFRVTGRQPQLWRADTGEVRPLSYRTEGEQTVVKLEMAPMDAYFVVFESPASEAVATFDTPAWQSLADIGGEWTVNFQPGRGAPASIALPGLSPLNEHTEDGVRYFSGTASYVTSFELPAGVEPGQPLQIDLGGVAEVAEVYVNGELAGTAWREPYRVDIGDQVAPGNNTLEVRVANLWVNRLIGDAQPDARKITWTSTRIYLPTAPLPPSGLLGPVTLLGRK